MLLRARQDCRLSQSRDDFQAAGVGQGLDRQVQTDVRNDSTLWWDRAAGTQLQQQLWSRLDDLQLAFNRNLFLGLDHFEGHYSIYPKGGFYLRHLDAGTVDSLRQVTVVIYLNEDWPVGARGQLRMHSGNHFQDISPQGGTLVCFLSQESEHEVLICEAERLSFTGWFVRKGATGENHK